MGFVSNSLSRICRSRPARLIETGNKPYLYRIFLFRLFGWNCYLHHFVSADAERWLHDHPFDGIAFVLTGRYIEERLISLDWPHLLTHERTVRWFNYITASCFHRILKPAPDTWTLFLHSEKYKGWGFLQEIDGGIAYVNPYGNVGQARWWRYAPTYGYLRLQALTSASQRYVDQINLSEKQKVNS